jgi:hypothetical protein
MHPDHLTPVFCLVEVAVPLPVNHAWVAYACRAARIAKPKWNPEARVWTSTATGEDGAKETISISAGATSRTVRVLAEWLAAPGEARRETATVRRVVTSFMTGMQWAVAKREGRDHRP